ncbi:hypothetical protein BOTCAL_0045g00280 [Botryotinia calthae]|uniref:Uncharacterized protein n=1 Tax=Botryotinia calthae TaxID=38488 RepID=A0A4Y8DBJ2_9HELO|nr:hypothetical protein BOTCAL_0045g00280 [Botryotinia calthae]
MRLLSIYLLLDSKDEEAAIVVVAISKYWKEEEAVGTFKNTSDRLSFHPPPPQHHTRLPKMGGLTAINLSSRHGESIIDTSFSAGCFRTRSAPNHQGLNHVLDLTTPSPPVPLRASQLNCSPMPRPSEDTRIMRPTLDKSKGIVKIRIPLPNGSSQDIANPDQFTKRREKFGSFISPTRSEFWATVMQAPADISTPSENHPKRKSATSIQNSTHPIPPQTRARKDFWAIVMHASEK